MKCKVVRNQLLACAKPARPPAVIADHLAQCCGCRAFQRRLVRLERLVPELPVPVSTAKADCLNAVLNSDVFVRRDTAEVPWRQRERALQKVAIAFAMAAGLLFFALVYYAWQHQSDTNIAPGPTANREHRLEDIVNSYDRGALEAQPRQRLERLAAVAQKLHDKTKEHVQNGEFSDVNKLAVQYETLVKEGILAHAAFLPEADREEVLSKVAEQFSRAESEANYLARQNTRAYNPLNDMAVTAGNARTRLREMAGI
jgi:hypothetical protein